MSDSNQNLEATCNFKLKLELIHHKDADKLAKDELCSYLANAAILELRIFSRRYHFRLWVFAATGKNVYC